MSRVSDVMRKVLDRCSISFEGDVFSRETLMQTYADFLSQTLEKHNHNVGMILHPGSICFDALIITYAAISNIMFNQTNTDDVLDSLSPGDIVLYGTKRKQRFEYKGKIDGAVMGRAFRGQPYIELKQDNGITTYIPESTWRLLEPYKGKAKTIDGRGIRRKVTPREDFFTSVLGFNTSDIPSVIDTSTVLVMSKDKVDSLIKGISICFDDKEINLLDLVTASYCTEDGEHIIGGNPSKSESVLKACSKVSVARKLILSKSGNRHIGLIVMGQDVINRGESELPELINRKSLQYVYICSTIDTDCMSSILDEDDKVEVFACTKEFLNEKTYGSINQSNSLTNDMASQIERVRRKENAAVVLNNPSISTDKYRQFRKSLVAIKRNQYESDAKENFIVHSHSLINLMMTAPFSLSSLKKCYEQGLIPVEPIDKKLSRIDSWSHELPSSLQKDAAFIVDTLSEIATEMEAVTPKETWLIDYLSDNQNNRIAVVVPKAYYATVIKAVFSFAPTGKSNITIITPGRFDNSIVYDSVIVLGDYEGKKFNAFRCYSSHLIISLLYEPEEKSFRFNQNKTAQKANRWNRRSTIKIASYIDYEPEEDVFDKELFEEEKEIENYVSEHDIIIDSVKLKDFSTSGRVNLTTEIIAVATFSDDTKAYFSRHYKAYVLDTDNERVNEISVPDLSEGDSVIFTKNNSDTQDIVGSILKQMIDDGKLKGELVDDYNRSKEWQRSLISYMETNDYSPKEVAKKMIELKVEVQEPTIIRWLDENTHTVGPKKEDSIRAIGQLTGNEDLKNNSSVYFESCRVVRKIRRQILNEVGNAIIRKLSGKNIPANNEFAEVYDKVDSLAQISQIDRLVHVEMELPMNVANRPISV